MYVRIARFEGGSTAQIEEEGARIRRDLEAARRGEEAPRYRRERAGLASRIEMLIDRERGATAMLVYAETAEQARALGRSGRVRRRQPRSPRRAGRRADRAR